MQTNRTSAATRRESGMKNINNHSKGGRVVEQLLDKLYSDGQLSKEETVLLLKHLDQPSREMLYTYAELKRLDMYGDQLYTRGLIEFSTLCRQNCLYCPLRASNKRAKRLRLRPQQIIQCCEEGYSAGFRTFVLESGEDSWYSREKLVEMVREIKIHFPDAEITLAIGERDEETYSKLFQAGANCFLMRHETASPRLYSAMHPTSSFERRRACLNALKLIGYQVGTGFMVGLPGQTYDDLAEDLLYVKQLKPDIIDIGPSYPIVIPHCDIRKLGP